MTLPPGTRLGPYEVVSRIGAGGMGVVYQARDTRLGREVAIKLLPRAFAEDGERLRRFELEARTTGSLNHPNLLVVFDTGVHEEEPYLVMELLSGETLRQRLSGRAMPAKKALEVALPIAQGLSAAHEKGIVHRDLKPDNIFLTRDGRVKILDFGLAKVTDDLARLQDAATETLALPGQGSPSDRGGGSANGPGTAVGTVVGSLGYMSPEQVRGDKVDGRSDLFCLGIILWEMLTGKHPFLGKSAIETLHAILKDEPPELDPALKLSPLLERVLHTCLSKDPAGRFHSAHDLAFALEACSGSQTGSLIGLKATPAKAWVDRLSRPWLLAVPTSGLLFFGLAWGLHWPPFRPPALPTFTRLTFAPGMVEAAHFSADGRSVYYSGRFQGGEPEIFVRTPESPEGIPLNSQGTELLGVSQSNDLAVLRKQQDGQARVRRILAQMPGGGGSLRDLLEDVTEAAWQGGGPKFAVLTEDSGFNSHLEYPPGKVLHTSRGTLKFLCMPRRGERMALVDGTGGSTEILLVEPSGVRRTLLKKQDDSFGATLTGMAWKPDGTELWYSESQEDQTAFWALGLDGRRRLVWRGHGLLQLMDLSEDGRVLAAAHQTRTGVFLQDRGDFGSRDVSILNGTQAVAFTPDGGALLLLESLSLDGGTARDQAYLRDLKGAGSPIRLAVGNPRSLSSDGRHVGMNGENPDGSTPENVLTFVPTGAGQPIKVTVPGDFEGLDDGLLFQKGTRVLFAGLERGKDWRFYTMDRQGGTPVPFTPVGVRAPRPLVLSPDGRTMLGTTRNRGEYTRYPLDGSEPRSIKGLYPGEAPFAWSSDGRGLMVFGRASELPVRIHRLDPDSGQRWLVHTMNPPDTAGYLGTPNIRMKPDGSGFAFTFRRRLSELFLIQGLK